MPNQQQIRSEAIQDILTRVPHWMIIWGNTIVMLLMLIFIGLSWLIKYPDVIISEAIITTEIPPQKEHAKVSGVIDTLLVFDNQKVATDAPLAIIENTANYNDMFFLKSIIDTIQLNRLKFEFPIDAIPMLFLGEVDSYYALFENSYLQYQLNKKLQPYSNEAIANQTSISELKGRLRSLKSQKSLNEAELIFQKGDLKRHTTLYEKGVISLQEYELKQTEFLRAERSFATIDASISQIREALSSANKTSIGTEISKTKEETSLLKSVIQSFNQLKQAIKDWEMRYVLSSKINGTVSFLHIRNENQNVSQGELVFTIIPEKNTTFIAHLTTPAQNSGKIKNGQKVLVQMENFPEEEFGALEGIVHSISVFPNKDGNYLVDVALPSELITTYKKKIAFKQEMKGIAQIITEDLRLIDRLFYQLKGIFK